MDDINSATCSACSDDETIDFEHELSTDIDEEVHQLSSAETRFSLLSETDQDKGALNPKDENEKLEKLSKEPEFKIIGQQAVGLVSYPTTVVSPWVTEAVCFSAAIGVKEELPSLDSITGLAKELHFELQKTYDVWFPVQKAVLPDLLLSNNKVLPPRDVIISAPTGSGKTLCFVLPILNSIRCVQEASSVFALCIAPVQDLAQQIYQEFCKYNVFGIKIVLLNGLSEYESERSLLFSSEVPESNVHVIVATPGRLMEHLVDTSGVLNLSALRFLIIDEADRIRDTARVEWLNVVERRAKASINHLTIENCLKSAQNRWLQKILVSATLSLDIENLHVWNLRCPKLFKANTIKAEEIGASLLKDPSRSPLILPSSLSHHMILCMPAMKPVLLFDYLDAQSHFKKVIVFVNHRDSSRRLSLLLGFLARDEFITAEISSNLAGKRRYKTMKRFEDGQTRVLIASDVLSRGIDISNVDLVVNYDPPINERIFFHRAGRTARGLNQGTLLSLVTKEEKMRMKKLLIASNAWTEDISDRRANTELSKSVLKKYEKALKKLKQKCV